MTGWMARESPKWISELDVHARIGRQKIPVQNATSAQVTAANLVALMVNLDNSFGI